MFLYHYAKQRFPVLKTLAKQKKLKITDPHGYQNHISFFFERPPLDKLGVIFGEGHHTWHPGARLFEHVVLLSSLHSFFYELVESPKKTELFYNEVISDTEYFKQIDKLNRELKYQGNSLHDLNIAIRHNLGQTEKCFLLLPSRPNFQEIRNKYAPTVPHLMVYPTSGEIKVSSVNEVTIPNTTQLKSMKW